MEREVLVAQIRKDTGKAVAKKLRSKGEIPAVVNAKNEAPIHITTDRRDFIKLLHKQGENVIIDLKLKGEGQELEKTAIIKEIQYDNLKGGIFHIDFQQIKLTDKIRMHVRLMVRGDSEAPGVKAGGIMEHVLREVEIECLPTNMPKELIVDVSSMEIGNMIHIKDLVVGEGITIINDPGQTVIVVKMQAEEKLEEEKVESEEEAAAEPEVIKKGKAEEEVSEEE
ncbi:MAG: 50S ribosomal protein L25 [Candidatus Omnitrophica bacterium]|nr:50S ribosomal protein L25 [Candidatus Omnitrophota bacterium]